MKNISPTKVQELLNKGLSQQSIAKEMLCSRQWIHHIITTNKLKRLRYLVKRKAK